MKVGVSWNLVEGKVQLEVKYRKFDVPYSVSWQITSTLSFADERCLPLAAFVAILETRQERYEPSGLL